MYASTCDGKNNFKRVAVNGKKVYLKKTVTIHVALKEQKYTNAKAVTLSKVSDAVSFAVSFYDSRIENPPEVC